jgi:Na+/H+-dicarboxylate symporter
MCPAHKRTINPNIFFAIAIALGVLCGYLQYPLFIVAAEAISEMFINLLKLISLPIIFLSIVSTVSGMEGVDQVKRLAQKVLKYTLLTTVLAATIALFLFIVINPIDQSILSKPIDVQPVVEQSSYLSFFMKIIPSNLVQPFNENQVISVLFLAILLSSAVISLPQAHRTVLNQFFASLYAAVIAITRWIVAIMPIAVWAFITLFMRDLDQGLDIGSLALYLACVVGANLVQAFIVLPLLLKYKGISPLKMVKGMFPALSTAFFTKSSAAALPTAMRCAEENVGISRNVASFSFPLCTTINMNACAAFILITVLFVSMSNGMTYTFPEMCLWIILSTIAAIGNAGVPMGCYMLASAFLAAMGIPLKIMTVFILPLYTLIDMLESAINVWSDACVTAVVQQEVTEETAQEVPA